MADKLKQSQERADAAFKNAAKAAREKDKSSALLEYEAKTDAMRKKSARLKDRRLAQEADDLEAEAKAQAKVKAQAKAKAKKTTKTVKKSSSAKAT